MSQNWQQPPQQPQQPGGYGYPSQQPQYGGGFPPPPPPAPQGNVGLAIVAAFVAAVIAGLIYGGIFYGLFDEDSGEYVEVGYVGLLVGALVGATAGKLAPRNVGAYIAAAVFAAFGVVFGQYFGIALIISEYNPMAPGVMELFTDHFDYLKTAWEDLEALSFVFIAVAAVESFLVSKKLGG
ncbi:hypothetical protein [Streptomyces sp. NPDC018031]|uniref:hypothetical protein n=1 Tax=Streptomyces sp. NPDC018031 TaxID=3365033 RepID=UPI0037992487